jgi:regulator of RNase E activity RraA
MDDALLAMMRKYDTPTICNAIEVVQGKRGFNGFTRGTLLASDPTAKAMVGYAVTAKIAALAPPEEDPKTIRTRRMDYYRAMAHGPKPSVAVVEDVDFPHCIGAYWGEVNTFIHKGFGMSGTLTNGVMRDLGDMAPDYPVLAGSVGPSHGFVHVREIGTPVTLFGLTVVNGDLVHADRHGAVVVPADVVARLKVGIERLLASEQVILAPSRQPGFDFEMFEKAWEAFEKART